MEVARVGCRAAPTAPSSSRNICLKDMSGFARADELYSLQGEVGFKSRGSSTPSLCSRVLFRGTSGGSRLCSLCPSLPLSPSCAQVSGAEGKSKWPVVSAGGRPGRDRKGGSKVSPHCSSRPRASANLASSAEFTASHGWWCSSWNPPCARGHHPRAVMAPLVAIWCAGRRISHVVERWFGERSWSERDSPPCVPDRKSSDVLPRRHEIVRLTLHVSSVWVRSAITPRTPSYMRRSSFRGCLAE